MKIVLYICHFNLSQHLSYPRITSVSEVDYFCSPILKSRASFVRSSARVITSLLYTATPSAFNDNNNDDNS